MSAEPGPQLRSTGQVLERLQRLNLPASVSSIAADTEAKYLPPRQTAHRGRDGASGLWEPWMEQRAERLYRFRALARRNGGLGPTGDVLRLLLFFRDGWGWELVKTSCIQGYRLMVRAATRGVDNRTRKKRLDPDLLKVIGEDIAVDQYRPEEPTREQTDRVIMTVSLLTFGSVTETSRGTLDGVMDFIAQGDIEPGELDELKSVAPIYWSLADPSEGNVIDLVDLIDDAILPTAVSEFQRHVFFTRRAIRRRFRDTAEGKAIRTSPFTFFTGRSQREFAEAFRKMPIRITPPQLLGAYFLPTLLGIETRRSLAGPSWFIQELTRWYLQSAQFEEELCRAESEIRGVPDPR